MKRPQVSVLMTAFNRARYIRAAMASVLASSCQSFELIVVDDCSTDDTLKIAREMASRDERVRVHVNETNLGDYPNRNQAASLARGKYLKYLDSDDIIYPHGLEVMVRAMEQFPEAGFGLCAVVDDRQPHLHLLDPREAYRRHYFGDDLLARAPGSAIIRRDAFESVGGFSGTRQVGDHELWLALAARYPIVSLPRDLYWARVHTEQEKNYDSPVRRTGKHQRVKLQGLAREDCPLDSGERESARLRERNLRRKDALRSLLKGRLRDAAGFLNLSLKC